MKINSPLDDRRKEIARRFPERNLHGLNGYWKINTRAWIKRLIREIRMEGKHD